MVKFNYDFDVLINKINCNKKSIFMLKKAEKAILLQFLKSVHLRNLDNFNKFQLKKLINRLSSNYINVICLDDIKLINFLISTEKTFFLYNNKQILKLAVKTIELRKHNKLNNFLKAYSFFISCLLYTFLNN